MNKKKAQALILSLWILMLLTILAVSIGHRVSLALKLSRYQRDKLKALYLAKAGINLAIAQLQKDTNSYDALNEPWADNAELFKSIILDSNPAEFATVSYTIIDDGREPRAIYGAVDEERKININKVSKEQFIALLEKFEINSPQDIANNILIWRGDIPDDARTYESLGYPPKADKFSNIEELTLVKDITPVDLQRMKNLLTIYGDGLININTVSPEMLTIFTRGIAKSLPLPVGDEFADRVATKIIEVRDSQGYFRTREEINIATTGAEEENIFNNLKTKLVLQSNNFLIAVTGNVGTIKSKILAVYNRNNKKILYWHEG